MFLVLLYPTKQLPGERPKYCHRKSSRTWWYRLGKQQNHHGRSHCKKTRLQLTSYPTSVCLWGSSIWHLFCQKVCITRLKHPIDNEYSFFAFCVSAECNHPNFLVFYITTTEKWNIDRVQHNPNGEDQYFSIPQHRCVCAIGPVPGRHGKFWP